MGLNTNNVGEPSLLSYKLLKYIVSPPPLSPPSSPPYSISPRVYQCLGFRRLENLVLSFSWNVFLRKPTFAVITVGDKNVTSSMCNAMRLVSKEENVSKKTKLSKNTTKKGI